MVLGVSEAGWVPILKTSFGELELIPVSEKLCWRIVDGGTIRW